MWRLTRAALESGVSLVVFPEGRRTVTGRVGKFHEGVFRMAQQFGTPIVPVSIARSFEFNRKTSWMLRPATIVVHEGGGGLIPGTRMRAVLRMVGGGGGA